MIKKIFILALLAIIATGAFALDISVGGGALFDYSFNNGVKKWAGGTVDFPNLSFGGFGFLDANYAELDISIAYGTLTAVTDVPGNKKTEDFCNAFQFSFSILGKYPIDLGGFTIFPLLGADYNMVVSAWDKTGSFSDAGDLSQIGFLGGVGLDYPLSGTLFLRGEVLFHLRLPSKVMKDIANTARDTVQPVAMGPRIKIGVGSRL